MFITHSPDPEHVILLQEVQERMRAALQEDQLMQYAVTDDIDAAAGGKLPASGVLSVPKSKEASDAGAKGPGPLYKKGKRKGDKGRGSGGKKARGR